MTEKMSTVVVERLEVHEGAIGLALGRVDVARDGRLALGLPFRPSATFVGRQSEIAAIKGQVLTNGGRISVAASIEGLGGIGKTELVLQFLNDPQIVAHFKTIVWLDAAGSLPLQWDQIRSELGLPRVDFAEDPRDLLTTVYRALANRGRTLIVLDNATEWALVEGLVPPDVALVVTTRSRDFGGSTFTHLELESLNPESARLLLLKIAPHVHNCPGLEQLLEWLGGHALAVELAAYWLRANEGSDVSHYVEFTKGNQQSSSADGSRYRSTVACCIASTENALACTGSLAVWYRASLFAPTSAHPELLRVSCVGGETTRSQLRELGIPVEQARFLGAATFNAAYEELRRFHILARPPDVRGSRWTMHRLVRDYARSRVSQEEKLAHALALSEWLQRPSLDNLKPELPHFVVAVLDSVSFERRTASAGRHLGREIAFRGLWGGHDELDASKTPAFDKELILRFIREQLHEPGAIKTLLAGLEDQNYDVRRESVQLLETVGAIPQVVEGLVHALGNADFGIRRTAADSLAEYGRGRLIPLLVIAANSESAVARQEAVGVLGRLDATETALIQLLQSEYENTRIEAALALATNGSVAGISVLKAVALKGEVAMDIQRLESALKLAADDVLRDLLSSSDGRVRCAAALQLCERGRIEPLDVDAESDAIVEALNPANWKDARLLVALRALGSARATKVLTRAMDLGAPQHLVIQLVLDLRGFWTLAQLLDLFTSSSPGQMRAELAMMACEEPDARLLTQGQVQDLTQCIGMMMSGSPDRACRALLAIGGPLAVSQICVLLRNCASRKPVPSITDALRKLKGDGSCAAVAELVRSKNRDTRLMCVWTLQEVATSLREIPDMSFALHDSDTAVRRETARLIFELAASRNDVAVLGPVLDRMLRRLRKINATI